MIIYKITNLINKKSYIGKTERTFDARIKQHKRSINSKSNVFALQKAFIKYGIENFSFVEIARARHRIELDELEKIYISTYDTFGKNGYNMTAGGEGQSGWKPSIKTKTLWSKQRKGKKPWNAGTKKMKVSKTEEEKLLIKQMANQKRSQKLKGRKTWNTGLNKDTDIRVAKIGKMLKGRTPWNKGLKLDEAQNG